MRGQTRKLVLYETVDGKCPWHEWFSKLKDRKAQAALDARLLRLQRGQFGDCKRVGAGVSELRVHYGPGYRVYFGEDGDSLVVLLCGGSKRTQKRDIARAKAYWTEYRSS
jgi:putative addiction module killer protein